MTPSTLRGDCAQCAALCCVALAFDRSSQFAYDKLAGEPCANLSAKGRCAIHMERAAKGFAGCEAYDCLGAGQVVTQGLFGGANWRDDPSLLAPMMRAFSVLRPAHEALSLLRQARRMSLPVSAVRRLEAAERELDPAEGWIHADVAGGRIERATAAAHACLRSLAPLLKPPALGGFPPTGPCSLRKGDGGNHGPLRTGDDRAGVNVELSARPVPSEPGDVQRAGRGARDFDPAVRLRPARSPGDRRLGGGQG
jgi:hypothetical protein